ncbi:MAG TPA: hypothetical protein VGC26_09350 [Afipia sp.]
MKKTKTILGAAVVCAALAAVASPVPASARSAHGGGCSGENLNKVEANMETMADWGTKPAVAAEIAAASTALSNGDARGCAVHISKAERLEVTQVGY